MKLFKTISEVNLSKDKNYLLACSFGPDSMSLFYFLLKNCYTFSVAHVNYKTRKESDYEENSLKELCNLNNINFYCSTYKKEKTNFESDARSYRYNFFKELCEKNGFDAILTAHHADDLIETYIMQKERKILPEYYGILDNNLKNIKVLRPFLNFEKETLIKYCDENGVKYSIDISNYDEKYLRNKIRKNIIQKISFEDKQATVNEIKKLNNKLNKLYAIFDTLIEENISKFEDCLLENNEVLQRFLFYFVKKNDCNFKNSEFKNLIDVIKSGKNKALKLNDIYFIYSNKLLYLCKKNPEVIKYSRTARFFDQLNIKINEKYADVNKYDVVPLNTLNEIKLSTNISKKVKRFFIDCKMPLEFRYVWPCIVDKNGNFIYTPRYRNDFKYKKDAPLIFNITNLTKIMLK